MASIVRYNSFEDLAIVTNTTIALDDIVYGASFTDSTTDVNEPVTGILAADTSFDVDSGAVFAVLDVIKIDSEAIKITAIATNTLTVVRGYMGTTAADHADNTQVDLIDAVGVAVQVSNVVTAETGTARGGSTTTIQLKASPANNIGANGIVRITSGTGSGQIRRIVTWANATRTATVDPSWTTPDTSSVYSVEDRVTVGLIKGNFNTGGETIYNQDEASATTTQAGTGASVASVTYRPSNMVIVQGDYSATTNIFRSIADAMTVTTDYTNPSSTSHYLTWVLGNNIRIGRKDQVSATIAYSRNEMLDISSNIYSVVRINGNSSHASTLELGIAEFIGDDNTAFPPLRSYSGSKMKLQLGVGSSPAIYCDTYGNLHLYDSEIISGSTSTGLLSLAGTFKADRTIFYKISSITPFGTWYLSKIQLVECLNNFIPFTAPTYCNDVWVSEIASIAIYMTGSVEGSMTGLRIWTDNGATATSWMGGNGTYTSLHLIDSDVDINNVITDVFGGYSFREKEHSFELTVTDEQGNAISGAEVEVRDKYNYNVLATRLTENAVTSLFATTGTSFVATPNNDSINIGDKLLMHDEHLTVTNVDRDTEVVTVTRASDGTTARDTYVDESWLFKLSPTTTDANGTIGTSYKLIGEFSWADAWTIYDYDTKSPFYLIIQKNGYEPYFAPMTISGSLPISLKVALKTDRSHNQHKTAMLARSL